MWLLLGQSIADFPAWVRGSSQVALGYSEAMAFEEAARQVEYAEAAALLLVLGLFIRASATFATRRSAWIICGSLAIVIWISFKEGFVRHDLHSVVFFFAVPLLATAVPRRPKPLWPLLVVVAVGLAFTADAWPTGTAPLDSARSFGTLVHSIASSARRAGARRGGAPGCAQLRRGTR